MEKAIFAGGCFWCTQAAFDGLEGVTQTISGYTGGASANPSYEDICHGNSGHREAIEVTYDPARISYDTLLERFWETIDPFDEGGQFYDRGEQYETAIFYGNDDEKRAAERSKATMEKRFKRTIATKLLPASAFYPAEAEHQHYHLKNPLHFQAYKTDSGRGKTLKAIWKKK